MKSCDCFASQIRCHSALRMSEALSCPRGAVAWAAPDVAAVPSAVGAGAGAATVFR